MARKQSLQAVFFIFLVISTPFTSAQQPKDAVTNIFVGAFLASVHEARSTRGYTVFDRAALLAWQRANVAFMAKTLVQFLVIGEYGLGEVPDFKFYDPDMNIKMKEYGKTPVDDLTSVEERKEWAVIMTTMALVFKNFSIMDYGYAPPFMRRSSQYANFEFDMQSPLPEELLSEFGKIVELVELLKGNSGSYDASDSNEQRRFMQGVLGALNTGLTNLGGLQGLLLLLARTTLYNFVMPYIYATYQLYFAHSQAKVNAWRTEEMAKLVCRTAIAQGRGSHPGNAGCQAILVGEKIHLPNDFRKREQLVDAAPNDDEMSFDAKAVADYLKKWAEDPSLRIEAMDLKAIRDLHELSNNLPLFSPKFNLVYKEKLLHYCHFAAKADSHRKILSTCPLRKA